MSPLEMARDRRGADAGCHAHCFGNNAPFLISRKDIAMKMKTIGPLFLLAAVTTATVTATVLAQDKGAKKRIVHSRVDPDSSKVPTKVGPYQPVSAPPSPSSGVTSVGWVQVEPFAQGLHVMGQAYIRDKRPKAAYVWSVRVRDHVKKVFVAEKRYDTLIFQVPQDTGELSPTFEDALTLSLPPGTYKVELVLYEVPPGGVSRLSDPVLKEHQLMAKNTVRVVVGR
jgi:hypothetical protein